jgi:hypothetical protein
MLQLLLVSHDNYLVMLLLPFLFMHFHATTAVIAVVAVVSAAC